jgi:hypothetical protein
VGGDVRRHARQGEKRCIEVAVVVVFFFLNDWKTEPFHSFNELFLFTLTL